MHSTDARPVRTYLVRQREHQVFIVSSGAQQPAGSQLVCFETRTGVEMRSVQRCKGARQEALFHNNFKDVKCFFARYTGKDTPAAARQKGAKH